MRADFYMIAGKTQFVEQPLLLVCQLAVKALAANQPCLIFCESAEQADFLDDLLWDFEGDAFVPHQIVGTDEDEEVTPVLLVPPGVETPMRNLVINLRSELPPPGYARVLEIVPADETARDPARKRWLEYKQLGFELKRNEM
ncbi:MAG TPA: DNA polymerase III subunit chi [Arenimonas sp.]|nr:DNA polymerase III subunit chi [Arenimonas sp.]